MSAVVRIVETAFSKCLCECVAMERWKVGKLRNERRGRQGERTSIARAIFVDGYQVRACRRGKRDEVCRVMYSYRASRPREYREMVI